MNFNEISDQEWRQLAPVLSDTVIAHGQRGRPRVKVRAVANAVLWILTTAEPWARLPGTYPSIPTCRNRFEKWRSTGALAQMHKLLSDAGRTLRCGPDGLPDIRHATPRVIERQSKDEGLRQVFWKDQATWQTPRDTQPPRHTVEPFTQIARQLPNASRTVPERVQRHAPVERAQSILRTASPWMGLASKGKCEFDPRGYVIYLAADPVANGRFRGWAEIVRDARRIARSGLIGPSFRNIEAAQQYAFEWARRWIDEASSGNSDRVDEIAEEIDVWQQKVRSG
ncbi:transposase [Paraburkholderia sp. BL23I1N1]|uniref:transposase n=1 Tax=Paraburkholderia sp. BL23I1N1 TaxID=1938802 RepID=UPI0016004E59|nr:transposase [Paraburkholderia sp. BL23I1N1]